MFPTLWFLPLVEPADPAALGRAVVELVETTQLGFDRITMAAPRVKTRAFRARKFVDLCEQPEFLSFTLWRQDDSTHSVDAHVRDNEASRHDELARYYETRCGHVISTRLTGLTDELRRYLTVMAAQSRLAHGFMAGFERYADAIQECMSAGAEGPRDPDPAREQRLMIDGRRYRSGKHLRRLYPITIIGPDLWAALPPMPHFDPMPTVEELGDCKLLTAWPTLCDPRDPDFLRGTRDLRAWLWPYTIQNPADHVDNDP